jgi:hypothetical protein
MAFESVRSYVQLASGLGEMTRARAMEAAQGLLALPGADEVTRRAVQASTLADQLLEAAKANRASLLALVQGEVEEALRRADVARAADVDAARAALSLVAKELADLRRTLVGSGASAVAGASRTAVGRSVPSSGAVSTAATRTGETAAKKASSRKTVAKKTTAAKTAATKSPAKKTTASKASTQKAATKKAATKKAATKKAATKKAATRKAATRKVTTKSAAKRSAAEASR